MNKEITDLISTIESLMNITKYVYTGVTLLISLLIFGKNPFKAKGNTSKNKVDVPFKFLGKKYIKDFKKPRAREKDFFNETGIKSRDSDIQKFIDLKRDLKYNDWILLKIAQWRIRFNEDGVSVKWNVLDRVILWLVMIISGILFYYLMRLITLVLPLLLHAEVWVSSNIDHLFFLLFIFLLNISYLVFFIKFLKEPLAVVLVKKDIEKLEQ